VGVVGDAWAALRSYYSGLTSAVRVGGAVSEPYPVETGLMEGALLSPFLYTVFIDGLARELEAEGLGARLGVGGAWVGALYYADDLALVAESAGEMQKMLRVVDRYCREWHFQPSFDKTKVLRFGKAAKDATPLYLPSMHHTKPPPSVGHVDGGLGTDTNPVSVAAEYPYLGVVVHDKRGFTRHVEEVVVPAMQAALVDVFDYAEVQGGLPLDGAQAVVRAVVQSKAAHGAGVWAPVDVATGRGSRLWAVTQEAAGAVRVAANKAARVAVGVPTHTPMAGVWAELKVDATDSAWAAAVVRLWVRVTSLPRGRLAREAWEWAWEHEGSSVFVRRVRAAHQTVLGQALPPDGRPSGGQEALREAVRIGLRQRAVAGWEEHVARHVGDGADWYSGVPVPGDGRFRRDPVGGSDEMAVRAMTGLRLDGSYLQSRVGALGARNGRVRVGERACPLCLAGYPEAGVVFERESAPVEDVPHFLALCPGLAAERAVMLGELEAVYPGFGARYAAMLPAARAEALLFTVPDGRWPSQHVGGAGEVQRARATRAVAGFVRGAAVVHPCMGRALWVMDR